MVRRGDRFPRCGRPVVLTAAAPCRLDHSGGPARLGLAEGSTAAQPRMHHSQAVDL